VGPIDWFQSRRTIDGPCRTRGERLLEPDVGTREPCEHAALVLGVDRDDAAAPVDARGHDAHESSLREERNLATHRGPAEAELNGKLGWPTRTKRDQADDHPPRVIGEQRDPLPGPARHRESVWPPGYAALTPSLGTPT